jgi:superfamily II DNA or RNA helicase
VTHVSSVSGTIEVRDLPEGAPALPGCSWDPRTQSQRAAAVSYAAIIRALVATKIPFTDAARNYSELTAGSRVHREPRPYQTEALTAWRAQRGRGVVVLPTGSGKSHVALLAIGEKKRSTLVVAPTLDLVRQWFDLLTATFGGPIGLVGGG